MGQEALAVSGIRGYFVPLTGFSAMVAGFRLVPRDRLELDAACSQSYAHTGDMKH